MTCYHPRPAWQYPSLKPNGKTYVTFKEPTFIFGNVAKSIYLPCNKCIGCRLQHSREWAIRIHHEASLYPVNSFLTLTYDDASLPENGSLNPRHTELFLKRLRSHYAPQRIRFYLCGEYGDKLKRPHYHAIIFNLDFPDQEPIKSHSDNKLFKSPSLSKLWTHGFASIGTVTFQSAAYVARYITKKINGKNAEQHYQGLVPEYSRQSTMPGLGHGWFQKYWSDLYPDDFVVMDGRKYPVPRYYDKQYALTHPDDFVQVKLSREAAGASHPEDQTSDRLLTREAVQVKRAQRLTRTLEKDET